MQFKYKIVLIKASVEMLILYATLTQISIIDRSLSLEFVQKMTLHFV